MSEGKSEVRRTRSTQLKLRLSESEKAQLQGAAAAQGVSVTDLIVSRCVSGAAPTVLVVDGVSLREAAWQVQRVGQNLNQLVRAMNAHGVDGARVREAEDVLARVSDAVVDLRGTLAALQSEVDAKRLVVRDDDH